MPARLYLFLFFLLPYAGNAQVLKPGFDAQEYLDMLSVSSRQGDSTLKRDNTPAPDQYKRVYRSAVTGLENRWDLWLRNDEKLVSFLSAAPLHRRSAGWQTFIAP